MERTITITEYDAARAFGIEPDEVTEKHMDALVYGVEESWDVFLIHLEAVAEAPYVEERLTADSV